MRNRWFHRPVLHTPSVAEKRVTWLELFYDLIFVASFIQLGNGLSHDPALTGFASFVAAFVPLWVSWTGFTFFENRFSVDDLTHRLFVFAQMFAVGAMGISSAGVFEGNMMPFAVAASMAQGMVAVMYLRTMRQVPEARSYCAYWSLIFAVAALLWLVSVMLPPIGAYAAATLATLIILVSPQSRYSRELLERYPSDMAHIAERYGLLTLIVLGESFVKVLTSLVDQGGSMELWPESGVILVITCAVWWVYFDDVAGSKLRPGHVRWSIWFYAHLPLQIGVTALGVGIKKAASFSANEPAPEEHRWLLAGSLAVVFFAVAAIDSVSERRAAELSDRNRVNMRLVGAVLMLVLIPAGATMVGDTFLLLVTVIAVSEVIFDMMMVPFEAPEEPEEEKNRHAPSPSPRKLLDRAGQRVTPTSRPDVLTAIRKGAPSGLRRDFYFYLIEGSWTRVIAVLAFCYVMINVFFAGLYSLQPDCIAGGRTENFASAFFFSVQTMSTIGYGGMTPATDYGDVVSTIEAAVGLLGVALATGLMFAKVSRPVSGALFSDPLVVHRFDGERVLSFRVGNARGNEVVDATISFAVLCDEVSAEGQHLRRLRDLTLCRSRTPFFTLSWTAMHEIDKSSPLAHVDWDNPGETILGFVATIVGHDGTYGQTIYARKVWEVSAVRVGHTFVDVLSDLPDGRMMIDFHRFHDTTPDRRTDAVDAVEERADEAATDELTADEPAGTEKSEA
ncbi:MAG: low temperature requirement protein A [Myxococcota bacterium]